MDPLYEIVIAGIALSCLSLLPIIPTYLELQKFNKSYKDDQYGKSYYSDKNMLPQIMVLSFLIVFLYLMYKLEWFRNEVMDGLRYILPIIRDCAYYGVVFIVREFAAAYGIEKIKTKLEDKGTNTPLSAVESLGIQTNQQTENRGTSAGSDGDKQPEINKAQREQGTTSRDIGTTTIDTTCNAVSRVQNRVVHPSRKAATDGMNLRWSLAQIWDDDLVCPVCLRMFDKPVVLTCMHSYCSSCVQGIARMAGSKVIACPTCRKTTYVSSVDRLPKNWYLQEVNEKVSMLWNDSNILLFAK